MLILDVSYTTAGKLSGVCISARDVFSLSQILSAVASNIWPTIYNPDISIKPVQFAIR